MLAVSDAALGTILATTASLMFAFQYLFVRLGTREGSVTEVTFVSLLANVVILVPPAVLLFDVSMSRGAVLAFAGAGVAGSLLGRIAMFESIKRLGANRTSPIVATNALFATLLAVVVLEETLTAVHLVGVVFIVAGVAGISYQTAESKSVDTTRAELAVLMMVPLLAAVFVGIEPIFISLALADGGTIIPGTAIVVTTAFIGFVPYAWLRGEVPSLETASKPYAKWYVLAGVATTFGLLAAFTAVQTAPVAIAVPLIQTSPLLVIVLSALFLSPQLEEVTPLIVAATVIIILGAVVVSLSG